MPNAASSPKEEPNGLEDSINGAPAKRPHSPTEEDMTKRLKETEVRRVLSVIIAVGLSCKVKVVTLHFFLLQVVSNDDSTFKEPYPPSDLSTGEGHNTVSVTYCLLLINCVNQDKT